MVEVDIMNKEAEKSQQRGLMKRVKDLEEEDSDKNVLIQQLQQAVGDLQVRVGNLEK